jgi:hypothetical protein
MPSQLLETPPATAKELVRLSVDQYHRMIEAGILEEGAPIELLDGLLVHKDRGASITVHPRHASVVSMLLELGARIATLGCHLRLQSPLTILRRHEPEPDAMIVAGRPKDYAHRHPQPADVGTVIEVADSSLERDRTTKMLIYARAGIAQYCLVNLTTGRIEVYEDPDSEQGRYRARRDLAPGESVALRLPGGGSLEVPVDQILA